MLGSFTFTRVGAEIMDLMGYRNKSADMQEYMRNMWFNNNAFRGERPSNRRQANNRRRNNRLNPTTPFKHVFVGHPNGGDPTSRKFSGMHSGLNIYLNKCSGPMNNYILPYTANRMHTMSIANQTQLGYTHLHYDYNDGDWVVGPLICQVDGFSWNNREKKESSTLQLGDNTALDLGIFTYAFHQFRDRFDRFYRGPRRDAHSARLVAQLGAGSLFPKDGSDMFRRNLPLRVVGVPPPNGVRPGHSTLFKYAYYAINEGDVTRHHVDDLPAGRRRLDPYEFLATQGTYTLANFEAEVRRHRASQQN